MCSRERNSKRMFTCYSEQTSKEATGTTALMVLDHCCYAWHHLSQPDHCYTMFVCCCVTVLQYYCCYDIIFILKIIDWVVWFGALLRDLPSCNACWDVPGECKCFHLLELPSSSIVE
jgi:hypothetical protein